MSIYGNQLLNFTGQNDFTSPHTRKQLPMSAGSAPGYESFPSRKEVQGSELSQRLPGEIVVRDLLLSAWSRDRSCDSDPTFPRALIVVTKLPSLFWQPLRKPTSLEKTVVKCPIMICNPRKAWKCFDGARARSDDRFNVVTFGLIRSNRPRSSH